MIIDNRSSGCLRAVVLLLSAGCTAAVKPLAAPDAVGSDALVALPRSGFESAVAATKAFPGATVECKGTDCTVAPVGTDIERITVSFDSQGVGFRYVAEFNDAAAEKYTFDAMVGSGTTKWGKPLGTVSVPDASHFQQYRGKLEAYNAAKLAIVSRVAGKDLLPTLQPSCLGGEQYASWASGGTAVLLQYCAKFSVDGKAFGLDHDYTFPPDMNLYFLRDGSGNLRILPDAAPL